MSYIVSVIIPTYKDTPDLEKNLKSLQYQTYPDDKFEVIVVNNDPDKDISLSMDYNLELKILNQPKPGSYAARNLAIQNSDADILAFTDSDCIADKDWIRNGVQEIENHDSHILGGNIELTYKSENRTKAELYESVLAFRQKFYVEEMGFSVTANMFVKKEAFKKVGLFDDSLQSGGDYQWGMKASNAGLKMIYSDNTIIRHPARSEMYELIKKAKRVTKGQILFRKYNELNKISYVLKSLLELKPPFRLVKELYKNAELKFLEKLKVLSADYQLRFARFTSYYDKRLR